MRLTEAQKTLLAAVQSAGSEGYCFAGQELEVGRELIRLDLVLPTFTEGLVFAEAYRRGKWPMWAIEHFPTHGNEAETACWAKITWHYPLHMNVLVAASTRLEGTWKAYCAAVPGVDHEAEELLVLQGGDQVAEEVARALFPHMDGIPYAK